MNFTVNAAAIAISADNCDENTLACSELNLYLERQVNEIAPQKLSATGRSHFTLAASPEPRSQLEAASRSPVAAPSIRIRTPQRKARYNDPNRWRLHTLKAAVLLNAKCSNTQQIRALLKVLGVSLDLRYTSSWLAINLELMPLIERVVEQQNRVAITSKWNVVPSDPLALLTAAMRDAIASSNWHPVQAALATHAEYKTAAWELLNANERQQLSALVPQPVKLLAAAKRKGLIAEYKDASEDGLYLVQVTPDQEWQLVTSCGASIFLKTIAASSPPEKTISLTSGH